MNNFLRKEYDFYLGLEARDQLRGLAGRQVVALYDRNTLRHCKPMVDAILPDIPWVTMPAGEKHKTLVTVEKIYQRLLQLEIPRNAVLLCVGGGVVCDLGGFVAATYKRGIDCVYLPTTLMAMTDAAAGGKTGVDLSGYKNVVGLFRQPSQILVLPDFLMTLPKREMRNGMAEVLKHGLLKGKQTFRAVLKEWENSSQLSGQTIHASLAFKMNVVRKDPEEQHLRKILNFGHTVGHAIESLSLMQDNLPLKHGEAVALGMIAELKISTMVTGLSGKECQEAEAGIRAVFTPKPMKYHPDQLLKWMRNDKKNRTHEIRMALLKGIGKPEPDCLADEPTIRKALEYLGSHR